MINVHQRVSENREPGRVNMPSQGRFSTWHDNGYTYPGTQRGHVPKVVVGIAECSKITMMLCIAATSVLYHTQHLLVQVSADPEMLYRSRNVCDNTGNSPPLLYHATRQYSLSNSAKQTVLSPAIMLASHAWPPFRIPPPSPPPPCCSRPFEVVQLRPPLVLLASQHM